MQQTSAIRSERVHHRIGTVASLLISLWTGRKPTKRTLEMVCFYLSGWADEEELLAHIEGLKKHDD